MKRHAIRTLVLAGAVGLLAACGGAGVQEAQKVDSAVMRGINSYCDARAKALEELGSGEAGAAP